MGHYINVPIKHHPTIRYMVYNGYYKVMSNIPKMGQLPTPVNSISIFLHICSQSQGQLDSPMGRTNVRGEDAAKEVLARGDPFMDLPLRS